MCFHHILHFAFCMLHALHIPTCTQYYTMHNHTSYVVVFFPIFSFSKLHLFFFLFFSFTLSISAKVSIITETCFQHFLNLAQADVYYTQYTASNTHLITTNTNVFCLPIQICGSPVGTKPEFLFTIVSICTESQFECGKLVICVFGKIARLHSSWNTSHPFQ